MFTADDLIALRRVTDLTPAPDGTWLAVAAQRLDTSHRARWISELWRVPLDGAPATPLTRGFANDSCPRFAADGSLLFLSNRRPPEPRDGADDQPPTQVWCLPAEGGEPFPVTDEPLGVDAFAVAPRADVLVVRTRMHPGVAWSEQRKTAADRKKHGPTLLRYTQQPVRHWDHWLPETRSLLVVSTTRGAGRRELTSPDAGSALDRLRGAELVLSPDGRWLATLTEGDEQSDRLRDSQLVVFDLTDSAPGARALGEAPRTSFGALVFSHDGTKLAAQRHRRRDGALGRTELVRIDVPSGDLEVVIGEDHAWDATPSPVAFAPDNGAIVCTADWRGEVPIFSVELGSGEVRRVTSESSGGTHEAVRLVPGQALLVGLRHRVTHPPEPFKVALQPCAQPELLGRVSGFEPSFGEDLVERVAVTAAAPDGVPVQCTLVRPRSVARPPLVMWIHGGPIGAWSDGWHWRWNPLVAAARGLAVALPNPRGSTGFGQDFVEGIWGNRWGAECYNDLMAVADVLAAREDLDGERMAAMGGSFGGYMVNCIGGRTQRFRALVTHASIFDFGAFYATTDYPAWFLLEKGCAPHRPEGVDHFLTHSPHRGVGQWTSPTLIVHGERDYRVPIGEALGLFEWLQAHGVASELVVFPDEGHWITRPRNIVAWYEVVLDFLTRHLAADGAA